MSDIETDCSRETKSMLFVSSRELIFDNDQLADLPVGGAVSTEPGHTFNAEGIWQSRRNSVKRARLPAKLGSTLVAVKKVHNFKEDDIKNLVALSHRNIVEFIGGIQEDVINAIIMEFLPGGNLYEYLAKNRAEKRHLPLKQSLNWALQCAHGLEYLHHNNIIHRNVQSYNYLLSSDDVTDCVLKLCNFGLTKPDSPHVVDVTTCHGSPVPWQAPEVIGNEKFIRRSSDIYSLGVVIWELLTCKSPWQGRSDYVISEIVQGGKHLEISEKYSAALRKLLEDCWCKERVQRPAIAVVCRTLNLEVNYQDLPKFSEMPLRMQDVHKIASHLQPKSQWRNFALWHLCISEDVCDELEKETELTERICVALEKWLMKEGQSGTVGTLAKKLNRFRLFDPSGYKFICELKPA